MLGEGSTSETQPQFCLQGFCPASWVFSSCLKQAKLNARTPKLGFQLCHALRASLGGECLTPKVITASACPEGHCVVK